MKIREYKIIEQIGKPGGMGTVYKVRHENLDIIRAIKKLHVHLAQNDVIIKRFENEAKALFILEHPNIVRVHDFFHENDNYYLLMEFIDGSSLASRLADSPLDEQTAIKYFLEVLSTIEFAHSKKILHRDIKPSNILIDENDRVKVVDFGIAKMMDKEGLTATEMTIGSPYYMAPEQIAGRNVDERTEIYSLGITFFEMLTGEVPFNDTSDFKIYEKHQKEKIPSLKKFNKNISSKLDVIIRKSTAKKPGKRYQNIHGFAEAIDRYLALCALGDKTVPAGYGFPEANNETILIQTAGNNLLDSKLDTIHEGKKEESNIITKKPDIQEGETAETIVQIKEDIHKRKIRPLPTEEGIKVFIEKYKIPIVYFMLSLFILTAGTYVVWNQITNNDLQVNLELWKEYADHNSAIIKWHEVPGGSYYSIERMDPESADFLKVEIVPTTVFNDTGLIPNSKYTYRITAFDENENPVIQNKIKIFTSQINISLIAEKVTQSTIRLDWQPLDGVTNQILYREQIGGRQDGKIDKFYTGKTTEFTDKGLIANQKYSYTLHLKFKNNYEFESDAVSITTKKQKRPYTDYENIRKKTSTGKLYIISEPAGANIILDDKKIGKTPFRIEKINVGTHRVKLIKDGFADYSTEVNIKKGNVTERFILDKLLGELNIIVKPWGSIYIDGTLRIKDWDRLYSTELPTGKHTLTLKHKGLGVKWEKQFILKENEKKNFNVNFHQMVEVTVASSPWGEIYVDGRSIGETTPKKINVRVGLHKIGVRRDGYILDGGEKEINLEADLVKPLEFRLLKTE